MLTHQVGKICLFMLSAGLLLSPVLAEEPVTRNVPILVAPDYSGESSVGMAANGDFVVAYSVNEDSLEVYKRAFKADGTPWDDEDVHVNTFTRYEQAHPSVGIWANGNYVIAWHSYTQGGLKATSIVFRGYKANGGALCSETVLMPATGEGLTHDRQRPVVAVYNNGDTEDGFLVIGTESQHSLRGRKMKKDCTAGNLAETRFSNIGWIGQYGYHGHGIAVNDGGNAVVFGGNGHPDDPNTQRARYWLYDDQSASFLGGDSGFVSYTTPNACGEKDVTNAEKRWGCDVAMNGAGHGVFVWMVNSTDDEKGDRDMDIVARRFILSGTTLSFLDEKELVVNVTTAGDQFAPRVAIDQDGRFMVVWKDETENIYGRIFGTAGLAESENEVKLNQASAGSGWKSFFPDVAVNKGGKGSMDFVVVYGYSSDGKQKDLYAVTGSASAGKI